MEKSYAKRKLSFKQIVPMTDVEILIANRAIIRLRKRIDDMTATKEFLKTKKFHFGDIVQKIITRDLDFMFDCGKGSIGKIVGWDKKSNYYRVYYSKQNPYIGVNEEELELYTGPTPIEVTRFNPFSYENLL